MRRVAGKIVRWVWIPCLSLLLAWGVTLTPVYGRLESWALDSQQRQAIGEYYFRDTLVVEIDEASLGELQAFFGKWPYKRDVYALLLDYLGDQGVKAVVFDLFFSEAHEGDAEFRRAIARNGRVVLAASALNKPSGQETARRLAPLAWQVRSSPPARHWPAVALPSPILTETAPDKIRVGMISVVNDEDGVLRNLPLIHEIRGNYLPSLVLASLFPSGQVPAIEFLPEKNLLRVGNRAWPVDQNGSVQLQYPSNANSVLVMPLAKLAKAALGIPAHELERGLFEGKTVFVGNTALFSDRVMTPRGLMNGVYVMAIAHEALAHNLVLKPQQWQWNGFLLLVALLPALTAPFRAQRSALLIGVIGGGTVAAIFVINLAFFRLFYQQSGLMFPLLAASLSSLFSIGVAMREEAKQRAQAAISRAAAETALAIKQQRFVAMVSHEFRAPLSAIDASLQNLKYMANGLPPEVLSRHQKIHRASHRLQALIDNHLTEDRLKQAGLSPRMELFDLYELITRTARRAEWPNMDTHTDKPHAIIYGDAEMLRIAFSNLIDNAMKYSPKNSGIWIEGEINDNFAEVRIIDQGIGIASEDLPRIFDQYFRVKSNKSNGAGLGLFLVKQIVERHGGTISAESVPGQGMTMCVRLPVEPGRSATCDQLPPDSHPVSLS
jgi:signal transduction histidine kinase